MKWFYTLDLQGSLKVPEGATPPRSKAVSRRHCPKVMFGTLIGRPCAKMKFSGLVGIWECGYMRAALRGDRRTGLKKGDQLFEPVNVDGEYFMEMLQKKIIPAIRTIFNGHQKVVLQLDNATPHQWACAQEAVKRALRSSGKAGGGVTIEVEFQPANSPDTNLNDLGFYRSLNKRLPKKRDRRLTDFVPMVKQAFWDYPSDKLTKLCDTQQLVYRAISKAGGDNAYPMPHSRTFVE